MSQDKELVALGVISGAHGIKGEVKITSFTEDPAMIADYAPLSDKDGTREFKIIRARVHKGNVLIARIEGVDDRNGADALKGEELHYDRSLLPETDEDEFYYSDLVGLAAHDEAGALYGTITSVQNFGAGDLLEIALEGQKKTQFLPFTKDVVPHVDIAEGRVSLILPEEIEGDEDGADPADE